MSLIRPELRAGLWRGRELFTALALAALFGWIVWDSFGLLRWIGWAGLVGALAFALTGWQRMRLRPKDEGLGVVEVDEGRFTYWGPLSGGSVARDRLRSVALDHGNHPVTWVLSDTEGTVLHIPVNAAGQDALLDALHALPGLSASALLTARDASDGARHILWEGRRGG